jgi:hypothetical protein
MLRLQWISLSFLSLACTPTHKFRTISWWMFAKHFVPISSHLLGDRVFTTRGKVNTTDRVSFLSKQRKFRIGKNLAFPRYTKSERKSQRSIGKIAHQIRETIFGKKRSSRTVIQTDIVVIIKLRSRS